MPQLKKRDKSAPQPKPYSSETWRYSEHPRAVLASDFKPLPPHLAGTQIDTGKGIEDNDIGSIQKAIGRSYRY